MRALRFMLAVVLTFMMTAIVSNVYAEWGWKKFQFQIVDSEGESLPAASARAMINNTGIYNDAEIFTSEDSVTTASHAYLTPDSNAIVGFWGPSNSYNIRVTNDGRWDIFKAVGTTTHRLVFLGKNYQPYETESVSPESAPGKIFVVAGSGGDRIYFGGGSFGNSWWLPLTP